MSSHVKIGRSGTLAYDISDCVPFDRLIPCQNSLDVLLLFLSIVSNIHSIPI